MERFAVKGYNIVYLNCSDFLNTIYNSICTLEINPDSLKDKDLKKLIFHFFVDLLLKKSKNKKFKEKPTYFIFKSAFKNIDNLKYAQCFSYVIKQLKNLLPIPILVLENDKIFESNNGELKGYNEKISSFYIKRKLGTYKLRKYLQAEEFYELVNTLQDIKNIHTLSN